MRRYSLPVSVPPRGLIAYYGIDGEPEEDMVRLELGDFVEVMDEPPPGKRASG